MRVQRRRDGAVRLRLEHEDDLYHLDLLLEPGDSVRASTERREATQADRLRPGRGAKQKMTLTLAVEKVEYQPFGQRLRCHGPITEASRDVGLTEDQIAAIPHWQVADCFSPLERAVLAYTDGLVLQRGRVPDGVFEALKAELSDEEILEFTYITCTYMMHAIMSRALKLEYDDVDERVVEIAAPDGSDTDVMSMVDKEGN